MSQPMLIESYIYAVTAEGKEQELLGSISLLRIPVAGDKILLPSIGENEDPDSDTVYKVVDVLFSCSLGRPIVEVFVKSLGRRDQYDYNRFT